MPDALFPPCAPYASRQLAVGDGHGLYVEECGNPAGLPLVFLHGGPGSGCSAAHRRLFDPARYRAVLYDQRGCGRSAPLASFPAGLRANDSAHLVADLEAIRDALGIERWLVTGGSWGSLLALRYAQSHPERVLGLVLRGIFLGSPREIAAYLGSLARVDPVAWRHFREATSGLPGVSPDDLPGASLRLLADPALDPELRRRAAHLWLGYEALLMGGEFPARPPAPRQLAKAFIQGHYLANGCFVDSQELLAACVRLRDIPVALIHGLADPVCPPHTAQRLRAAWPAAHWHPVPRAGHGVFEPDIACTLIAALESVARVARAARNGV